MDEESRDGWSEIEWLLEGRPAPMDPARVVRPSLTNSARPSPSVIALSTMGPRRTGAMPLDDPAYSFAPGHGTSPQDSLPASCPVTDRANKLPATLIRTLEGCICAWSHGMESRYGFPANQAVGVPSHQLLRTMSWQTFDEINRELLDQQTWSGGLIHHRLDSRPVLTVSSWHLHRKFSDEALFVTELHADIVPSGFAVGTQLADVLAAITHEMSEALTAVHLYSKASRLALNADRQGCAVAGLTRVMEQSARATQSVELLRKLAQQLRGTDLHTRARRQTTPGAE